MEVRKSTSEFVLTVLIEFFHSVGLYDLENPLCYRHFLLIKNDMLQEKSLLAALYYTHHKPILILYKANEMHYFSDLFDKVLYMFRTSPLFIIRSISTLYTCSRYLSC